FNTALAKRTLPFSAYSAKFAANKDIVNNFNTFLKQHHLESLIGNNSSLPAATGKAKPNSH
ncbi:MAG: hypothetical protein K2X27_21565, partial [Candidatus Obscuribacterales bacterium]|nr:hypothetical protein [Candidatus Obscuribacterales bacterium]